MTGPCSTTGMQIKKGTTIAEYVVAHKKELQQQYGNLPLFGPNSLSARYAYDHGYTDPTKIKAGECFELSNAPQQTQSLPDIIPASFQLDESLGQLNTANVDRNVPEETHNESNSNSADIGRKAIMGGRHVTATTAIKHSLGLGRHTNAAAPKPQTPAPAPTVFPSKLPPAIDIPEQPQAAPEKLPPMIVIPEGEVCSTPERDYSQDISGEAYNAANSSQLPEGQKLPTSSAHTTPVKAQPKVAKPFGHNVRPTAEKHDDGKPTTGSDCSLQRRLNTLTNTYTAIAHKDRATLINEITTISGKNSVPAGISDRDLARMYITVTQKSVNCN